MFAHVYRFVHASIRDCACESNDFITSDCISQCFHNDLTCCVLQSLQDKVENMFQKWLVTLTTGVVGSDTGPASASSLYTTMRDLGFSRETLTREQVR